MIWPMKGIIGVNDDSRARCDGNKLDESKIDNDEVNGDVVDDEVGKKDQKAFKSKN